MKATWAARHATPSAPTSATERPTGRERSDHGPFLPHRPKSVWSARRHRPRTGDHVGILGDETLQPSNDDIKPTRRFSAVISQRSKLTCPDPGAPQAHHPFDEAARGDERAQRASHLPSRGRGRAINGVPGKACRANRPARHPNRRRPAPPAQRRRCARPGGRKAATVARPYPARAARQRTGPRRRTAPS